MSLGPLAPLAAYDQFIVVLLAPQPDGRTEKCPLDSSTAKRHDAHDPSIWLTYERAATTAKAWGPQFTTGFVLTAADPFWCLDIDGALHDDGTWSPLSVDLCQSLPNTCVEVSQSGRGLHIWGQGVVPEHSKKNLPLDIELYTERRFIAMGTQAVGDMRSPCPTIAAVAAQYFPPRVRAGVELASDGPCEGYSGPTDDEELLRRAMQSRSAGSVFNGKASFAELWRADTDALARTYPDRTADRAYDASSADAALAQLLAFWTGKDALRIARLMERSELKREKWENRPEYLSNTITVACGQQIEVLADKKRSSAPTSAALPAVTLGACRAFPPTLSGRLLRQLRQPNQTLIA